MKQHWSDYWNEGMFTSLPSDFKGNYDGELEIFWRDILVKFVEPIRILDLCTGNGAVAILLTRLAEELNISVEVHGVDASKIAPDHVAKKFQDTSKYIAAIKFTSNCRVENIPEKEFGMFDLIVSQYGLEYCDTASSAKKICNLLKRSGRLVFISHSAKTDMLEHMLREQEIYDYLVENNVFDLFMDFSTQVISPNRFKNKLKEFMANIGEKPGYMSQNLFRDWLQTIFELIKMNNPSLKLQRDKVGYYCTKHTYAKFRADDMVNVTKKLINNPFWFRDFEDAGLKLVGDADIIYKSKHNVGHYYEFINQ